LDEPRTWPALVIREISPRDEAAARSGGTLAPADLLAALLDDFSPAAIEDLTLQPLPPGGLWDPTFPPIPDPPPSPLQWRVFFSSVDARADAAAAIERTFPALELSLEDVGDGDWAARSQRELCAITAGTFIVAPPWDRPEPVPAGMKVIVIEPSRGFGTGHHASTRQCLRALSDVDVRDRRVLDLGTGSGVLAMAAALGGAREVRAVDVDPDAIEAARESAALNQLPLSIGFAVSDYRESGDEAHDVVLANLTSGMLISSAPRLRELVAPGGLLIMSGFDEAERGAVRRALDPMNDVAVYVEDGWVGLVLRR